MGRSRPGLDLRGPGAAALGGPARRKAKLAPLPLRKARAQLEALAGCRAPGGEAEAAAAFLVLPGPFELAHGGHLSRLEAARAAVAARAGVAVLGGFLAPVAGGGEEAAALADRAALCRAACEGSSWIDVCDWGWAPSARVMERMGSQLAERLAWTGGSRWDLSGWWVLSDSDELRRHLQQRCLPAVCVGDAGADPILARCLRFAASRGAGGGPAAACAAPRARRFRGAAPAAVLACGGAPHAEGQRALSLAAAGRWEELAALGCVEQAVVARLRAAADGGAAEEAGGAAERPAAAQEDAPLPEGDAAEPAPGAPAGAAAGPGPSTPRGPKDGGVHFTTGDAAKASRCGGAKIIAHICNDQGNGGRGFFQEIKREWGPAPSRAYFEWHRDRPQSGFRLGAVQFVQVAPLVEVANMIGQQGSKSHVAKGSSGRIREAHACAAEEALRAVGRRAAETGASVHMPMVLRGAGYSWEQLGPLAKKVAKERGVEFFIYR